MEGLATQDSNKVVLNEEIIKKYICPIATQQEVYMFLQLCKAQNLNPFLKEAYLIKYGSSPATIVTGKDTFIKRARSIKEYRGFKAGIIVISNKAVVYREGGMLIKGEELIGGWAEVYRCDLDVPVRAEVTFDEYVGKKADGAINKQWTEKPATMIRKVALVQAHREAFPNQFEGMYSAEEMGVEVENIEYKDNAPAEGYKEPPKQPQSKSEQAGADKDLRAEVTKMVNEMIEEELRNDYLLDKTAWDGKDKNTGEKKHFEGKTDLTQVSDAAIKVVYGKVKKDYEAWTASKNA